MSFFTLGSRGSAALPLLPALPGSPGLRPLPIDIAQRDDLLVLVRHDVAEALAAAANLGDADLGARRDRTRFAGIAREADAAEKSQHGRGRG